MRLRRQRQAGNVFFALFAATAMVGIVGAGLTTVIRGPATSVAQVTRQNMAENNMIMSSRLAVVASSTQQADNGDCDGDGYVEPLEFRSAGASPHPVGGGYLPMTIGATLTDPWQTEYGYCVWDHGDQTVSDNVAACGGDTARRLNGAPGAGNVADAHHVIAIISAGKDRAFQTSCNAYVDANNDNVADTPLINKPAGSDDIVFKYTYAEALKAGDGLWSLKPNQPETATIAKDLEVTGSLALIGGGLLLPDQATSGDCEEANDQQIRRNTTDSPPSLEICDWQGGAGDWEKISGAGGVPSGAVVAFKDACPSGWTEVTNLAGRVIIGAGTLAPDTYTSNVSTGGAPRITLSTAQMPSHNHSISAVAGTGTAASAGSDHAHSFSLTAQNNGSHQHTTPQTTVRSSNYTAFENSDSVIPQGGGRSYVQRGNQAGGDGAALYVPSMTTNADGTHSHTVAGSISGGSHSHNVSVTVTGATENNGSGVPIDIRPPFRAYVYCESAGTPVEGVTLPNCANGQTLQWDGAAWECETAGAGLWQLHANNADIFRASGNVGIGNSAPGYALDVTGTMRAQGTVSPAIIGSTSSTTGRGVQGTASATTGVNYGVAGHTDSTDGRGVHGWAAATTGATYGGYFASASTSGVGVQGYAAATTGATSGVHGRSDSTDGRGVRGYASAASGTTYGVLGRSDSTDGRGVRGEASAASGATIGVYGTAASTTGTGIQGEAGAASGATFGARGLSASTSGIGVNGVALAATGTTYGVYGQSDSTSGRGVTGIASATTGATFGVSAHSASTSGVGIYGLASATTGAVYGVVGRSDSTSGQGIRGYASAATGTTHGVVGLSESTAGRGVYGRTYATTGTTHGVYGEGASTDARGVTGVATAATGSTYGVLGVSNSTDGRGVRGYATAASGTTYGLMGQADSTSGWGVYCNAAANASGCGGNRAWNNASDGRLKDHIADLAEGEGLAAVMRLRPVTYKWRAEPEGKTELGFIAQEVEKVFPELVGNSPDTTIKDGDGNETTITDVKSLSYAGFVVPLVKAVQELKVENDAQRDKIAALEARATALPASPAPPLANAPPPSPLGAPWLVWLLLGLNVLLIFLMAALLMRRHATR